MEPPKCRYCGHNHWLNEGHVSQNPVKIESVIKPASQIERPKFDRTAYQREYMRKYRKK